MSHFTKVATKINSLPALLKALDSLDLHYTVGSASNPATVRGYMHQEISAEISIDLGHGYDIGIVRGMDGNYELAGDWWGIESYGGRTEREIVDEISHEYSVQRVAMACAEAGYAFEGQPAYNEATGETELVACKWG